MVIHDDDICLLCFAPRLEQKAASIVRARRLATEIRLGGDLVPHFRPRRRGKIGERSIGRVLRPVSNRLELFPRIVGEQSRREQLALSESQQTDVIAPTLEQREADLLLTRERPCEKRKILSYELLLQVDGVGRDDRALAVRCRPTQRRHQVRERFSDAGACLEESYSALVVQVRDGSGHFALALAVFVHRKAARDRAPRTEISLNRFTGERN